MRFMAAGDVSEGRRVPRRESEEVVAVRCCGPRDRFAVPLSVLDLAPVVQGSTPADALRNSIELAAEVERLGYHRFWVAEHHNMPGIASSSPAVLLAHVASVTSTIRLGSGGVMLPNHASARDRRSSSACSRRCTPVASTSGIGRAPGTDPLTARALRGGRVRSHAADDFPEQLVELFGFFRGEFPDGHPYRASPPCPALGYQPALWLLGSSDYSARAAGLLGLPFSFAYHFARRDAMAALAAYRSSFRAVGELDAPYVMLGVTVGVRRDRRARAVAGRVRRARDPAAPVGSPGPVPDARGGRGVPLHAGREGVRQGVDRLAHRREPRHRSPRARSSWSSAPAPTS